jgi:hypothetical protein
MAACNIVSNCERLVNGLPAIRQPATHEEELNRRLSVGPPRRATLVAAAAEEPRVP